MTVCKLYSKGRVRNTSNVGRSLLVGLKVYLNFQSIRKGGHLEAPLGKVGCSLIILILALCCRLCCSYTNNYGVFVIAASWLYPLKSETEGELGPALTSAR